MADNVTTNPGAGGETFATDDIGGVHYPISKIAFGATDTATPVSSANPFPVSAAGAAAEATLQAMKVLSDSVATMTETIQYVLTSILEKMPRVDASDRLIVSHAESSPAVNINTNQDLRNIVALGSLTNIGGRDAAHSAYALANVGALHIYDNIRVT